LTSPETKKAEQSEAAPSQSFFKLSSKPRHERATIFKNKTLASKTDRQVAQYQTFKEAQSHILGKEKPLQEPELKGSQSQESLEGKLLYKGLIGRPHQRNQTYL